MLPQETPLLPLDTFREYMQYNPWHFWGMANDLCPVNSECNDVLYEYAWQYGVQAGREDIRRAILSAEQRLKPYLHFSVAPHFVEETVEYFQRNRRARQNIGYIGGSMYSQVGAGDAFGRWTSVEMSEGYIHSIGVESITSLGDQSLTYSDDDGDGLNESFTLSFATTETDTDHIEVYFSSGDRLGEELGDRWRVQPVQMSISSGTCTIKGRAWTVVKPIKYRGATGKVLDPSTSANFVSTLEVCTRKCNPDGNDVYTSQATFIWETLPAPQWWGIWTVQFSTDPAAIALAIGRCGIRDPEGGIVAPGEAIYNTTTGTWAQLLPPWGFLIRRPDRVRIRYYAGYPLESDGQMDSNLRAAVTHLAMAELPERLVACDTSLRELHYWQFDLSRVGTAQEQYAVTKERMNNPFGSRRGHVDAWERVKRMRQIKGIAI